MKLRMMFTQAILWDILTCFVELKGFSEIGIGLLSEIHESFSPKWLQYAK